MLPALSTDNLALIAFGAALGGLTRGFTGFGFAMIFMPIAASVVPPPVALAVIWVIDAPFAMLLGARSLRQADMRGVTILLLAATLAFPLGLFVMTHLDPVPVRWIISGLITMAVMVLASGWRYHGEPNTAQTVGVGTLSGLCSGLASIGGMPLALFWLSSKTRRPAAIRADMQSFFMLSTFTTGAILAWKGLLTAEAFKIALLVMPIYGSLLWLGARGYGVASETTFRRVAYAVILFAAVISLPLLDGVLR
jgi:uncharacterized membrane protein YfcA